MIFSIVCVIKLKLIMKFVFFKFSFREGDAMVIPKHNILIAFRFYIVSINFNFNYLPIKRKQIRK